MMSDSRLEDKLVQGKKNTAFCETISASKHLFSIQIVLGQFPRSRFQDDDSYKMIC